MTCLNLHLWRQKIHRKDVHPLLDNVGLCLALMWFPVGLTVLHVLQLQSKSSHILPILEKRDPFALVQTRWLTDPHTSLTVAHT